ncbi:hypothetical protein RKE29_15645 [Streptomyces sp. B1866]|uniref:hypothetical protein n=1 Tax=Streptomyces sp. B1866 TaxID=3075431 RepID=UPI00288EE8BF|nr:hypothetical protein [Streptomyces sp. B1866]MDT3398058.1 hypothetical protein [Streptomyces sp. B1866]
MTHTTVTAPEIVRAERALSEAGLPTREGWRPVRVRRERHDGRPVTVVRYQDVPSDAPGEGGPHLTVVVDDTGLLLGYTRLDPEEAAAGPQATEDEAREAAFAFLAAFAPRYATRLTVQWVAPHHERVAVPGGTAVITGTKVKTRHAAGLYAWVVVGPGGTVLTYERDIRWDSAQGRRGTEMWLHDAWIAAREGTGPQPAPPYALA